LKEYVIRANLPISPPLPLSFNVSFVLNSRSLYQMHLAVSSITAVSHDVNKESSPPPSNLPAESLQRKPTYTEEMRRWLFPEPEDGDESMVMPNGTSIEENDWVDVGLNEEQRVK
jgi:hypothetical protein